MEKVVNAKRGAGYTASWNLNLFSGPKWTIVCGECEATFKVRIPLVDCPTIRCPNCKTLNRLNLEVEG